MRSPILLVAYLELQPCKVFDADIPYMYVIHVQTQHKETVNALLPEGHVSV